METSETIAVLGGIGSFIGGVFAIVSAFLSARAAKASSKSAETAKSQGDAVLANFREQVSQLETHNTTLHASLEVSRQAALLTYLLTELEKLELLDLEIQRMTENSGLPEDLHWEAKNILRTQNSLLGYAIRFNDPILKNKLRSSRNRCAHVVNRTITDDITISEITNEAMNLLGEFCRKHLDPRRGELDERISEIENSLDTGFSRLRNP